MLHEVASGRYNQVAWVLAGYQVNTPRYFWASWLLQQYFWITPISVTSGEGRNGPWYEDRTLGNVFRVVKVSNNWHMPSYRPSYFHSRKLMTNIAMSAKSRSLWRHQVHMLISHLASPSYTMTLGRTLMSSGLSEWPIEMWTTQSSQARIYGKFWWLTNIEKANDTHGLCAKSAILMWKSLPRRIFVGSGEVTP